MKCGQIKTVVIEIGIGFVKIGIREDIADDGGDDGQEDGRCHVVCDELSLGVSGGEERADDGRFFFNEALDLHGADKGERDEENDHRDGHHGDVSAHIVHDIRNTVIVVSRDAVDDAIVFVRDFDKCPEFIGGGFFVERRLRVIGVGVFYGEVLKSLKTGFVQETSAEISRVHEQIAPVSENRRIVGEGNDAHDVKGLSFEPYGA